MPLLNAAIKGQDSQRLKNADQLRARFRTDRPAALPLPAAAPAPRADAEHGAVAASGLGSNIAWPPSIALTLPNPFLLQALFAPRLQLTGCVDLEWGTKAHRCR